MAEAMATALRIGGVRPSVGQISWIVELFDNWKVGTYACQQEFQAIALFSAKMQFVPGV
jgi:hypothetical protein